MGKDKCLHLKQSLVVDFGCLYTIDLDLIWFFWLNMVEAVQEGQMQICSSNFDLCVKGFDLTLSTISDVWCI